MSSAAGSYELRIVRSAEREMRALPEKVFRKTSAAILGLASQPRPHDSKKLRAGKGYRVRVGVYRIVYTIDDSARSVAVISVRHRKDAYRR